MAGYAVAFAALWAAGGPGVFDLDALVKERESTLASFRDPHASPLAAVARHDFAGDRPMTFGSAQDSDVPLEGVPARAAVVRALPDGFELEREGKTERLAPGAKVPLGRYTLRLSHQNFPGVVVLDPLSPRLKTGPFPVWFAPDAGSAVEARLLRETTPREEVVLSTRGNKRRALRLGKLEFTLQGKVLHLTALRLLEPGAGESSVSVFFRDATTFSSLPSNQSYRPLVSTLFALDYWLGHGLRPFWFHLSIFALFFALVLLAAFFIDRLIDPPKDGFAVANLCFLYQAGIRCPHQTCRLMHQSWMFLIHCS